MKKRLVITGAGGFLGRHLIQGVLKYTDYEEIIAITIGAEELNRTILQKGKLRILEAGALSRGEMKLDGKDVVINCAYPRAMKGKDVTIGLNYIEYVFQESAKAKIAGIINISSQSVYDPQRIEAALESDIPVLTDEYSIGKYCSEMFLRNICAGIPYTNIRLASLIGPGFDVRVPNKMVKSALETGRITAEENKQRFGYLDVEDAVNGLINLLSIEPRNWKHVYNMGGNGSYSLVEIATEIKKTIEQDDYGKEITIDLTSSERYTNSEIKSDLIESDIGHYCWNDFGKTIHKIVTYERSISKKGD